ncbi:MAG TPA: LLM class F420-dependent oxidoreductase [Pseudorhizobium sp.]|nr:LLM class F420-dependent oxidoreductase [Pseudorhizobium sp.]
MKFGLFGLNMYGYASPQAAADLATRAEAAGFESIWCGEHVVLPDPQRPPSPMAPLDDAFDPVVALTYLAAATRTVRLGTGIIILPQRNPLVLAKELASLDVLSGGRLDFGIGVGYLEPEFRALGAPFEERGRVTDEYLAAMREIWTSDTPHYDGTFVSFSDIQSRPQPLQKPTPPIHIGGRSRSAFRRAVEQGNGWYGFAMTVEDTQQAVASLRKAAERYERPAALGDLEISVTPRPTRDGSGVNSETVKRFVEVGVNRLIPIAPRDPADDETERFLETMASLAAAS